MPAQNRVTPLGDVVAAPLRCRWMGNRGCLHEGLTVLRHHRGRRWIICETDYKDWRAAQWAAGRYTVLFFHDEAVALAAGHRPCALCRRARFELYRGVLGRPSAPALDDRLHAERWDGGRRRLHQRPWRALPAGAFAVVDGSPVLVLDDAVVPWTPTGYGTRASRPRHGDAAVVTPPSTLQVLAAGYPVQLADQVQAPVPTGARPAARTRATTAEERMA
ncbi:MAG: hypothetical protein QOJ09_2387 [Actinomycetota bacterium]|nr:hypothetical protein [Actinomycetota bacterium]